ncbi:MAG: barstar family protein [Clostridia bacterium]|nr:barstar family protein [Clostridia bacterium]
MTQGIFIDADRYATARELHLALKMMLGLPEHYGCNADALYDCLSERKSCTVNLCILTEGEGETADALKKCSRVIEDLGGEVVRL